ncbi:acetyl-CoA hydrolase/transferase family protein [Hirschia litorea]|uniref:Acetyl-CoA hydrolase/transferase family protein n=1 Tax=Hirschia litorea TaxID=1199156 RepID=A0ABW2IH86_9PROT
MIYHSISDALTILKKALPAASRLYVAGCSGEPIALSNHLKENDTFAENTTFLGIWIPGVNKTDWASLHPTAKAETIFLSADLRSSFETGDTQFLPLSYTQSWRWLSSTPLDGGVVMVSPPDKDGNVSLGVSSDFSQAILARNDVPVLALINHAMPSPPNAPKYPLSRFLCAAQTDTPLIQIAPNDLPDTFAKIGQHIASLIDDGDTLQFGLGNVQQAVLGSLKEHKNLKIHAGMISDPLLDLIDSDSLDRSKGSVTTGVAIGTDRLYQHLKTDESVCFEPVFHTHDISTLSAIPNLKAINSAIEVDLFGQANAEFINGKQVSGTGGLVDFLRGSAIAPNGQGIIALASTAKRGTLTRITPRLQPNATSIARADMDTVVTEHGIAVLKGKSIEERAQALIAIADPAFHSELQAAWANIRSSL